ncbi:heavy-metal-associated domain-containing protein [Labilibaculum euxinus]|uniref:heavy-metal-associated domain-containing protein n=1 Tax=Labilibaculum euxinus TaxID=2686357 RepID=UPI001E429A02|nr:heavy-metal-associated domain-containing protein [Labilibaculum euxinus]
MYRKILSLMCFSFLGISFGIAQTTTESFKVSGNCEMCETRIEKAALAVDGVSVADWNKESKMIDVTFDSSKTDNHKVHMAIAKAGHDTQMHKAKDEVYNKLPGCCQYERASLTQVTSHEGHDHSACSHKAEKKESDHSECTRPNKKKSGSCCNK